MASLVIGMGEVGNGLFKALLGKVSVMSRDKDSVLIAKKVEILHITFPYSDQFVSQVEKYIKLYKPELTIVYSTVPIGTCEKIGKDVVHSPVEGQHPHIYESILSSPRWLGTSDEKKRDKAAKFWSKLVPVRLMPSSRFTEFLKLRSTAKYAINIVWTDYENTIAKDIDMNFSAVKQFDMDYNVLYQNLGSKTIKRYVLDPPKGAIGGHCLVPNAKLLDEQYPHPWLKEVIKMEKK